MALHIQTPLIESRALSLHLQKRVWLKLESMQPSGSFKIRGIGAACEEYARRGAKRFISSSGGNAGMAVAYAGRQLSIPVTVVVPEATSKRARQLIEQQGAELVVTGDSWQEAHYMAQSMMTEQDAFLHPFDDPLLWEGHASLIDEIAWANFRPDAVVLSVGGGGLFSGVVAGLRRNGMADVPVVTVETRGAESFYESLQAGHRIVLSHITSIATTLGAKQICERAFKLAAEHSVKSLVVSDGNAITACRRFLDDHRIMVEPACGAALAAGYMDAPELAGFEKLLFVVCGGVNVTATELAAWDAVSAPR